jgi:hypothetical protein
MGSRTTLALPDDALRVYLGGTRLDVWLLSELSPTKAGRGAVAGPCRPDQDGAEHI